MKIALITRYIQEISLILYDENLLKLNEESFKDFYSLNFYLQTIPKKFGEEKTLLIYNDLEKICNQENKPNNHSEPLPNGNNLQLIVAQKENSYFIGE
jgi:hypothetical protein